MCRLIPGRQALDIQRATADVRNVCRVEQHYQIAIRQIAQAKLICKLPSFKLIFFRNHFFII